ncbi:MAG TPA: type II toxin-antitoxin system VapC family toxin [Tepidisphaeraceae bacterium]|nr:type II toxin-antitoxin system VapC family toxin [Tepidisphaeraceae bacterium]
MVIDSSAILAVYFNEPSADWVSEQLLMHSHILMSTVNLAEVLMRLRDRDPANADVFEAQLIAQPIQFVAPDVTQTRIASRARDLYPINFGDCFAYALAKSLGLPLLTLDADFRKTDLTVLSPPDATE